MELDSRIKSKNDILTCFDLEQAIQFIGQEGYFADVISSYQNLGNRAYGTLTDIEDNDYPFKMGNNEYWRFFIPECSLKPKPKEKKFRPFKDTKEFFIKTNFEEGDLIHIRSKNKIEYWLMLVGWTNNAIKLGTDNFTFENLFENFELWDGEERFIPFGVLEDD